MRIGVLGGGQLGRMLALSGLPLGLDFCFYDPSPDVTAAQCGSLTSAEYTDLAALEQFAAGVDVVTYEFENVPVTAVDHLLKHVQVYPPREALFTAQDRLLEKDLFELQIPTPNFFPFNSEEELRKIAEIAPLPLVLKTRRLGYDGKGQFVLRSWDEIEAAIEALGDVPAIAESFVPYDRELSLIGVRSHHGVAKFYPLVENIHEEGILRLSLAPTPGASAQLQAQGEKHLQSLLDELNYVGVLTLELFQVGNELLANEMAPRVHNSGHWTIEGAATSQFENHLRAILGFELGGTDVKQRSAMINFIGEIPRPEEVLHFPGLHFHSYRKEPREGRKVGHLTACADTEEELFQILRPVVKYLPESVRARVALRS